MDLFLCRVDVFFSFLFALSKAESYSCHARLISGNNYSSRADSDSDADADADADSRKFVRHQTSRTVITGRIQFRFGCRFQELGSIKHRTDATYR